MDKKYISFVLLFSFLTTISLSRVMYSNDLQNAKNSILAYLQSWFLNDSSPKNWAIDINGLKFSDEGLLFGIESLEENMKTGKVSKAEQKSIRQRFVDNFIDQTAILAISYEDLINNDKVELLLQDFLRQAATQLWLEKQVQKNPKAIIPTQAEIDQYYSENADRLLRLGLSASQIKLYAEQELRQMKLQEWTAMQMNAVRDIATVKLNPELKKKIGL